MPNHLPYNEFIQEKIASGEFWLLIATSLEWEYVVSKIQEEFFGPHLGDLSVFGSIVSEDLSLPIVYWMKKRVVPAEVLAFRVGLPVDVVRKAKIIKLRPFPEGPVKANVDYFGTA